jgi:hypothetical protein
VTLPSEHFFTRVSRYAGGENRLTAVLAAVLEHVPSLAWTLARAWTDPRQATAAFGEVAGPGSQETFDALESRRQLVSLALQVAIPSGDGWVDLELRFGHAGVPAPDDVLLWIEVKHWSHPRPDQIPKYLRNLPRRGTVLLVAPRSLLPYGEDLVPPSVPQRSWQAVAENVRKARSKEVLNGTSKEDFLIEELYNHMQDQHLTDPEVPEVLRREHLVALAYGEQADRALRFICRWVSEYLEREWGPSSWRLDPGRTRVPRYGLGYWEAWALDEDGRRRAAAVAEQPWEAGRAPLGDRWLDWNVTNDPTVPESLGRPLCFVSGLCAEDLAHLAPSDEDRERARRLEDGVEIDGRYVRFQTVTDTHERLVQVAQPEQVLVGPTLREQSASLGAWIIAGFKALTVPLEQLTTGRESDDAS